MQRDGVTLTMRVAHLPAGHCTKSVCPAVNADKARLHIGAVAFIYRFGSSLNEHVHLHVCAVDGVFEEVSSEEGDGSDATARSAPPRIIFHPATSYC